MRLLVAIAAPLVGLAAVPAALAHATLSDTSPATQATVHEPPTEIRLVFDEPVTVTERAIRVLAADGLVLSGAARTGEDDSVVVAPVSGLARGSAYTVRWRVTSNDGHSPSGVFTFGVGVAAPPPTEAVGARGTTWRDDLARWALFAALALVIGPLMMRLVVLRGQVSLALERRFHAVTIVAALAVIDIGILAFVLRAANALQLPVGDLLYGDLQPFAEKTRFGIAFLAMTVGFGAVAALLLVAWIFDLFQLRWPALVLSVLLVSGLSLSSHQATEPNASAVAELADWLHLVSAAVWVGGLVALAFLVWPTAPALRARAFLGFARLAFVLVGVMVLAGAYLALVRLPTLFDLWRSDYGLVLLTKIAVVSIALAWGGLHHFVVRPRVEAGKHTRVRRSLVGETLLALAVLLTAAVLTNASPPPVEQGPSASRSSR